MQSGNVENSLYRWLRWGLPLLAFLWLMVSLFLLHRSMSGYHWREVLQHLHEFSAEVVVISVVFAFCSYLVLGSYDLLAVRYTGQQVRAWRTMMTAFIAFSLGHNIGVATLSGAAIRLRMYGVAGLSAAQVAVISGFCALTTALGSLTLLAYSLLVESESAARLLHLSPWGLKCIALVILLLLLAYVFIGARRRMSLRWWQWSVTLPDMGTTLLQVLVAVLDLCLAAACLYALLPASSQLSFPAFLAIYVLSIIAVLVTNVPGGVGVLESAMILALPQIPVDQLLASLLAYRAIYYFAPLGLSALALAIHEFWLQRHHVRRVADVARNGFSAIAPQALGAAVLVAGAVLLLSGATPAIVARVQSLQEYLPLPVLELSHLLGSIAGLGLVILSHSLFRRVQLAWQLAIALLLASALFSLLKGWDYEEALLMLLVAGMLLAARSAFYRRAALLEVHPGLNTLLVLLCVVSFALWLGFLAHRHVAYTHQLWWTFDFNADASRMLRAALIVTLLAIAFIVHGWMLPARPLLAAEDEQAYAKARQVVAESASATAHLALLHDKRLLLHPEGDAFLMYQLSGNSWVAMGDPVVVGQDARHVSERSYDLAWAFREMTDEHGGATVFYQVSPELLPMYVDLGLALLKLGEEARVFLPDFSLEGSHRAELRTARRRCQREGTEFEVLAAPISTAVLAELAMISDQWLQTKASHEKKFSVGFFSPEYLQQLPMAVVRLKGRIVAFANLWPGAGRQELSVDLMRYAADAPKGVMDYLFIEIMLWGRAQDYQWFNLGMAPLSGLERHPLAPAWHHVGKLVFDVGGSFYNFDGLRRYKEKFMPVWKPRYLAAPGGLALPRVLLDVSMLIAGGLREIVRK